MKKTFFYFVFAIASVCNVNAQNNVVILQCEQIGEEPNKVSLEIDLGNKKINVDNHLVRQRHEMLNQKKLMEYQKAVQANDEMKMKFWEPKPYEPMEYSIKTVTNSEVTAFPPFPLRGVLKVNRNTLVVYLSNSTSGALNEFSYKCEKVAKGF